MAESFTDIGNRLIGKTEDKPYSYRYMEQQTGYPFAYIQKVVTGKVKLPKNKEFYEAMAKALRIKPEEIAEYVDLVEKEKIDKQPKRAEVIEAILDDEIVVNAAEALDLPEGEKARLFEEIKEDIKERLKKHGKEI